MYLMWDLNTRVSVLIVSKGDQRSSSLITLHANMSSANWIMKASRDFLFIRHPSLTSVLIWPPTLLLTATTYLPRNFIELMFLPGFWKILIKFSLKLRDSENSFLSSNMKTSSLICKSCQLDLMWAINFPEKFQLVSFSIRFAHPALNVQTADRFFAIRFIAILCNKFTQNCF